MYGKDRLVFVAALNKKIDIKFRLLPVKESAITFGASDSKLPSVKFSFHRVGAYTEYSLIEDSILNVKTMNQLEKLCKCHDSEISVNLIKHLFTLTYYTDILVLGETDVESSDEESEESEETDEASD